MFTTWVSRSSALLRPLWSIRKPYRKPLTKQHVGPKYTWLMGQVAMLRDAKRQLTGLRRVTPWPWTAYHGATAGPRSAAEAQTSSSCAVSSSCHSRSSGQISNLGAPWCPVVPLEVGHHGALSSERHLRSPLAFSRPNYHTKQSTCE